MSTEDTFEPMDQDLEDSDTFQVQVTNDLFDTKNNVDQEVLDVLDFEDADDLEVTEFQTEEEETKKKAKPQTQNPPAERITIVVEQNDDDEDKEDGEISENQSHSGGSDEDDGGNQQYFSRSSSFRSGSGRRRNDINRERSPQARRYPNPYLEFDDAKIQSRALRFGLANATSSGAENPETPSQMSEEDLLNLYSNNGLIQDDLGKLTLEKVSPQYRLDSILIRGTNHMNTNEIFKYLYDLGQKPVAMEWVNDANCVVIYSDKYEAATSILKTSKPIVMDPKISERKRSIVEDVDKNETSEEKPDIMSEDFDYDKLDAISQSSITVPMPPGYVWRFGAPCEKAKGILVRFATKNDKKQERAERFSEYYKNYGNPNKTGPNPRQYISPLKQRGRKKMRPEKPDFEDQYEDLPAIKETQVVSNANDKNGWGQLSAMWDDEEAFQQSARDRVLQVRQRSRDESLGISPLKKVEGPRESSSQKPVDARDLLIQSRQKRKRGSNSSDEGEQSDSEYSGNDDDDNVDGRNVNGWKDNGSFRRKRNSRVDAHHRDREDGEMDWKERLTAPRMRMHADEEEERMKRRAFRRLGNKRGGESSFQPNYWDFGRENSQSSNSRNKSASQRRPVAERLGAKRNPQNNGDGDESNVEDSFDLRQKLNMKRGGGGLEDEAYAELQDLLYGEDEDSVD